MKAILSIFLAWIITFILLCVLKTAYLVLSLDVTLILFFPFFIVIIICGGLATWISSETKIRYSIYYGIIISGIYLFYTPNLDMASIAPLLAGMGGYIGKNEKGTIKILWDNKFKGDYKKFFTGIYKRNKTVLTVSTGIFFVSVIIGGIVPHFSSSFNNYMMSFIKNHMSFYDTFPITTLSVFLYNSTVAFSYLYIGGIALGIINSIELVVIGLINGISCFKNPFTFISILPYALFEILSFIIAGTAGFKLLITAINIIREGIHIKRGEPILNQMDEILDANYLKFRDSLILMIIAIILIFVAAIIQVNIYLI
jgi:stage II sporulation protein M